MWHGRSQWADSCGKNPQYLRFIAEYMRSAGAHMFPLKYVYLFFHSLTHKAPNLGSLHSSSPLLRLADNCPNVPWNLGALRYNSLFFDPLPRQAQLALNGQLNHCVAIGQPLPASLPLPGSDKERTRRATSCASCKRGALWCQDDLEVPHRRVPKGLPAAWEEDRTLMSSVHHTSIMAEEGFAAGGVMDANTALPEGLKTALDHDGLARGMCAAAKALDRRQVHLCVLAADSKELIYVQLVEAHLQRASGQPDQGRYNKKWLDWSVLVWPWGRTLQGGGLQLHGSGVPRPQAKDVIKKYFKYFIASSNINDRDARNNKKYRARFHKKSLPLFYLLLL